MSHWFGKGLFLTGNKFNTLEIEANFLSNEFTIITVMIKKKKINL